jgi:hypothetical protein
LSPLQLQAMPERAAITAGEALLVAQIADFGADIEPADRRRDEIAWYRCDIGLAQAAF